MGIILNFLKSYWYLILGPIFLLGVYWYGYSQGVKKTEALLATKAVEELVSRQAEAIKEEKRISQIANKIRKMRKETPANDSRDSCLLSSNPLKKDCLNSKEK